MSAVAAGPMPAARAAPRPPPQQQPRPPLQPPVPSPRWPCSSEGSTSSSRGCGCGPGGNAAGQRPAAPGLLQPGCRRQRGAAVARQDAASGSLARPRECQHNSSGRASAAAAAGCCWGGSCGTTEVRSHFGSSREKRTAVH